MALPTFNKLYTGRAGTLWNVLCCPIFGTIGLIWRSIVIFCYPCCTVLLQRVMVGCAWKYCCCCLGWPYEDDTFFGASALGDHGGESSRQMDKRTEWVRAQDLDQFKGKKPQLFEGDIEPNDLCQGAVGDCWLVAAFACGSEFPDMIRHMFLTKEYNPRGLYRIRIYDPQQEKWVIVTVDDRIPCEKTKRGKSKSPRFMKPNGNELWAIILEKAYAKHCGSYAAISGGFVLWGWLSMTGDHVFQLSLEEKQTKKKKNSSPGKSWIREDMVALKNPKDKRDCGFRRTKETYSEDQVWTLLKKYDRQKALISASIGKDANKKTDGPSGEQMLEQSGLVAGHAYSVIAAKEVSERGPGGIPVTNAKTFRLLQLRNPWGTYEWKGNWSDKSKLWKKHSSIAKQLNFVDADDGTFWMEFKDFKKVYTRINVCNRDTARDASLDVNEDSGACGIIFGFLGGCGRFWCLCQGIRNLYFSNESKNETLNTHEKCCWIC
mmetsp:Transcript_59474/g.145633  ORF Transcript_59474/g.145633 Transcript_59474/m.145633 type:complete len:490 (-) Transcript_59474:2606-4075(-)